MSNTPSIPSKDELIAKGLQELISLYNTGKDFAIEQVPDVIRQLIIYKTAYYGLWLLVGLVMIYISYRMFKFVGLVVNRRFETDDKLRAKLGEWAEIWGLPVAGGIGFGIGGIVVSLTHAFQLLFILTAPKVWLLEYAARLVK